VPLFPDDVNCDLDRVIPKEEHAVRPSELLIGAAALVPVALLPAALKARRELKQKARKTQGADAA
jgi:hypothetical protein